ncbi:MAG: DUF1080 domain-containing protein, partial [Bacteroidota bacterium]
MLLRTFATGVAILFFLSACNEIPESNRLSRAEQRQGFELLFDGVSTDGWRGYQKDHFPAKWVVEDGTLHCQASGRGEAGAEDGGDIIFDRVFSNFHLKLEWKIAEGGNSGIFYLGQEDTVFNAIYRTAPEMQVLDNAKHPDAKLGRDGNRQAGSLYDLIPAVPQNFAGAGEWNRAEVIHKNGHVQHIQNGEVVVEYQIGSEEWNELVAISKFPGLNPDWVHVADKGLFGVQDHGDDVWYRSIKIREL